jgi:hypothetical protein
MVPPLFMRPVIVNMTAYQQGNQKIDVEQVTQELNALLANILDHSICDHFARRRNHPKSVHDNAFSRGRC